MPYAYDNTLEDDEKSQNPSQVQISGASPTTSSGGSVQQAGPSKNPNLSTGSGFQNLDSYLKTNQPQQFASQVVGKVQGDIDTAKQNQQSGAQAFQNQVQTANNLPNQEQVNQAIANPAQANASDYQKWEKDSYTGPKSLAESQNANNQFWSGTNKANTTTGLLGNEAGRFTLLDQYYGRPTYNYGQKSLDNLLIQGGGIGEQTKSLQNQAAQLKSQGQQTATDLSNQAAQRASQVQQSAQYARNAIGVDEQGNVVIDPNAAGYGAIGKQYTDVNNQVQQANAQRTQQFQDFQNDLKSGNLKPEELSFLGLENGTNLYNLDLSNYLNKGQDVTKDQVMTPEQRAQIQALSQLTGHTDDFAQGTQQSSADPYSFDSNAFKTAQASQKAEYDKAVQDMLSNYPKIVPHTDDDWKRYNAQQDAIAANVANLNKQFNVGKVLGKPAVARVGGMQRR